jgi:HD-GYP domain-containing protein (c-di-GMP phosphodiesterase class II)/phosphoribosyl 1,2-cyclic phosphodiesterase
VISRISSIERLDLLLEVTRRLMSERDLDDLLGLIAETMTQALDAERATIFLLDADRGELWSKVALGSDEIRVPVGVGIAGAVAESGETINIADAYADERFNQDIDRRSGFHTRSLLSFPMRSRAEGAPIIGVFQAVNKRDGPFTADDEEIGAALASSAAVAIENAQLLGEQRRLWQSLLETLAVTIDARDQQTAGHTQRVARYAEIIGREFGLSRRELERLRAAGLLHDYGKIAVPDGVLMKPGKLSDGEFEYMRQHAEKTEEFLSKIRFPRDMRDVPLIAAQHHERMDGKGYPRGIASGEILVGARIVAAADIFDALTAPRYYKPAYSLAKTLEIMDEITGEQLDPVVMKAVRRAMPELTRALEELRSTWPEPIVTTDLAERDERLEGDATFRLRFWGTRGSIATPGASTIRYGGNTACVELRGPDGELVIFDAGTGLRELGQQLLRDNGEQPLQVHLLISHLHWDHIQGLPFFRPAFDPRNTLTIYGPSQRRRQRLRRLLGIGMDDPFFPVDLDAMPAGVRVKELGESSFKVGSMRVRSTTLFHPSPCLGYRVEARRHAIVYVTDTEDAHRDGETNPVEALARDADILIHDAQYLDSDRKPGWGHTTMESAVDVALRAGVRELVLYHHDPERTDDALDEIERRATKVVRELRGKLRVRVAREGLELAV